MSLVCGLKARNLRSIRRLDLALDAGLTVVTGANGAGKTTLIEALYLVARGRSFRGRRWGELTSVGEGSTEIEVRVREGAEERRWVYWREGGASGRRVDGLALLDGEHRRLGLRMVGEGAEVLLEGEPGMRRRFLDWNAFHVEPGYGATLVRFRRLLRQRNAWLKGGGRGPAVWDPEYASAGEALAALRGGYFAAWSAALDRISGGIAAGAGLSLTMARGWPEGEPLAESLRRDLASDRHRGFTRLGPGRADWGLVSEGGAASLSRGQAKAMVCLLQVAAERIERGCKGRGSLWLLDDLPSGLDRRSLQTVMDLLMDGGGQCVLTLVGGPERAADLPIPAGALFHVERGQLNALT
jgi:DNA replication and repair protein RecF